MKRNPLVMRAPRFNSRALFLAAGLLIAPLVAGCGGAAALRMSVDRPSENKGPIWVGVFYLSKEAALDGKSVADLIDKPEAVKGMDGVLDKDVFSVQPGKDRPILREEYEKSLLGLNTILVVANFPKPGDCARQKIAVKKGEDINYHISVTEKCLEVKKGK